MVHSYKDLLVWQKGVSLVTEIYKATETFPKSEIYGLVNQMRRSAVSIPSNIAEGRFRNTRPDFINFLRIAYGSSAELATQLEIAKNLNFISEQVYVKLNSHLEEVMKMLNSMTTKLKAK